jgi:hypothetical protein
MATEAGELLTFFVGDRSNATDHASEAWSSLA